MLTRLGEASLLASDIVYLSGGGVDRDATARNLAARIYGGFAGLSAQTQQRVVDYVRGALPADDTAVVAGASVSLQPYILLTDRTPQGIAVNADFSFRVIGNNAEPGSQSQHIVRAGDTLRSIAALYYGSPDYWYIVAEANGLMGSEILHEGDVLAVPNRVANNISNADTYKPYRAADILGATSPISRFHKGELQKFVSVIIIVVAVVVAIILAVISWGTSLAWYTPLMTAAIAYGANYGQQKLAVDVGLQEKVDYKAARRAGIAAGASSFVQMATPFVGDFIAGLNWSSVAATQVVQGIARVALEAGGQMAVNDGKISSISGLALAALNINTKNLNVNAFTKTIDTIQGYRSVVGAGLGIVEKELKGQSVNTLDWATLAVTAGSGSSGLGRYTTATGGWNWSGIAQQALLVGAASLVVGQRRGVEAGANFLGGQTGNLIVGARSEMAQYNDVGLRPFLTQDDINQLYSSDVPYWQRQAKLEQLNTDRKYQSRGSISYGPLITPEEAHAQIVNDPSFLSGLNTAAPTIGPMSYVVQSRDSYARIARDTYGDERYARMIMEDNGVEANFENARYLPVGKELVLRDIAGMSPQQQAGQLQAGGNYLAFYQATADAHAIAAQRQYELEMQASMVAVTTNDPNFFDDNQRTKIDFTREFDLKAWNPNYGRPKSVYPKYSSEIPEGFHLPIEIPAAFIERPAFNRKYRFDSSLLDNDSGVSVHSRNIEDVKVLDAHHNFLVIRSRNPEEVNRYIEHITGAPPLRDYFGLQLDESVFGAFISPETYDFSSRTFLEAPPVGGGRPLVVSGHPMPVPRTLEEAERSRMFSYLNHDADSPNNRVSSSVMLKTPQYSNPDFSDDSIFIGNIILQHESFNSRYAKGVPYFAWSRPEEGRYNSNSFVSGMLVAAGYPKNELPTSTIPLSPSWQPSAGVPLPLPQIGVPSINQRANR